MEGMTEEQKEYEAMKLVDMFDKLSRSIKAGYARTHARTHRHTVQFQVIESPVCWHF